MQTLQSNSSQLLNTLEDIVNKVQIESNFQITHPNYKPLELPPDAIARFQRVPQEIQAKYLSLQLRSFLYGIYYNGSLKTTLSLEQNTNTANLHQDLENNTFLNVDLEFYEQLHESNQGSGYFDPGWIVVKEKSDDILAVNRGNLTLHIERNYHLCPHQQRATVGEVVGIKMPPNFVQNGFYMAVGNAGTQNHGSDSDPETVRIYFNVVPEGAIALMKAITQQLNHSLIPFSFKVLYNPADYKRHDSGVLYFDKSDYTTVQQTLEQIYLQHQSYFRAEIPLFTKLLAPGLGLAEEPNIKFGDGESFGMNRCQIIANGLLKAKQTGCDSPQTRMNAVLQQFSFLGLDWQKAYLNANSEDLYKSLNL